MYSADLAGWNEIGRSVAKHNSRQCADFHEGRTDEPLLMKDPRSPELAEKVLAVIVQLNASGRSNEARGLFDPAHEPFIPELEKGGRGLKDCAILGPDEFLVNQGTYYTKRSTWHIKGDQVTKVDTLAAFAWSRNRQHFLAVQPDGTITLHRTYGDTPYETISSLPGSAFIPGGLSEELRGKFERPRDDAKYTHLGVSNDGRSILLGDAHRGVILLQKGSAEWNARMLYPSVGLGLEDQIREVDGEEDSFSPFLDMLHAALSPDGRFAAMGTQDDGHFLLDLQGGTGSDLYAKLGYLSEYPHDACFSDDSNFVAFNSCYFYNGVTFASRIADISALRTEPYKQSPQQAILNSYLRVYASGFIPGAMAGVDTGAFLLAGSGFAICVTPSGKVLWEVGFGSSAGGVDVCPDSHRILIASHSGMLHLFDPCQQQQPQIMSGYNAPQELRRWIFWDRLFAPIAW